MVLCIFIIYCEYYFKLFMHGCFIFQKMSSLSPLTIILSQNKLTGENYIDWKRNLFNILTAKGYKYVLTQPCPPEPMLYDYRNKREPYEKWCEANKMAKRYIYWLRFLWNCIRNIRAWKQPLK